MIYYVAIIEKNFFWTYWNVTLLLLLWKCHFLGLDGLPACLLNFLFFPLPIWTHHTIFASRKRYFTRLTGRVRAILRYGLSSLLSCQFLLYLLIILFMTFFTVSAFSLFMLLIDSLSIPLPKNWCYPLTVPTSGNLF